MIHSLIDLELPTNSYMIAYTNTQIFVEEGENCASTISVEHLEPLFQTIGYDMILFGSIFKVQEPTIILVYVLINFRVKNQVPKVSFKIVVGDLMSVFSHEFDDIILFLKLYNIIYLNNYLSMIPWILYLSI